MTSMMTKCFVMALLLQTSFGEAPNKECTGSECTEDADDMSMLQTKSEKIVDGAELQKELHETRQELKEAHETIGLLESELKSGVGENDEWGAQTRRRRR